MPELPEVEAARKAIEDHCIGRKIKRSMIADDTIVIDGVSRSDFEASLLGKTIVAARRKGKNMWIELDSPPFPSFQFGMAGAVYIKGVAVTRYKRASVKDTDEWPSKYSKFFVELDDGVELSFTDKRRFARVRLLENPATAPPISDLGPDALLEPMTIDEWTNSLKKKKIGIKALLLDQSFISGIGNWIADEVLYQARIHPLQIPSTLPEESCVALHNSIREVVQFAVEVDANCSRFPPSWLFHVRWGKKAGRIDGKKIEFIVAGGRTTAFVPALQKLHGSQAAKASMKLIKKSAKKSKGKDSDDDDDEDEDSKSGQKNSSIKLKGGRSSSGNSTPRVAAKRKVIVNSKDDGDDNVSDADNGTAPKRRSGRARIPPAKRKFSEGDKDGDDEHNNRSLKRKTRNVAATGKLVESKKDGDDEEDPSDKGLRRRPRNPPAKAELGESVKDGDEDPSDKGPRTTTRRPRNVPPAKAKLGEIGEDGDEDHHNNDDDTDLKKKKSTRTAVKPPAKTNSTKTTKTKVAVSTTVRTRRRK